MRDRRWFQILKAVSPGILAGVSYGVLLQATERSHAEMADSRVLMTAAYIFLLPFVMGALTLLLAPPESRKSWAYRILMPWLTTALSMAVAFLFHWEGSICLILGLPVYLTLSSIGGIVTGLLLTSRANNKMRAAFAAVLFAAPPLIGHAELRRPLPAEQIETRTSIEIHADQETVWKNIIRVPQIREQQTGFFYKIGFPKPVEATLSYEGTGAVRRASFEGGLVFIETVHEWTPKRSIAFRIEADPAATPLTTLDEHVTVGGRYFDVLDGRYEIEPLSTGIMRLHLKSEHRLSTHFNWYAGIWSSFLMSDIQNSILQVIKSRCEKSAP